MVSTDNHSGPGPDEGRREALGLLARAGRAELEAAWAAWPDQPSFDVLRKPEIGLVMVRGRTGGGGAPFNLGEATVTRATVRLKTGEIGFAQSLGRDRDKALLASLFDALWQSSAQALVESSVLAPIRARLAEAAALKARETAATRVNFFTLVRGED